MDNSPKMKMLYFHHVLLTLCMTKERKKNNSFDILQGTLYLEHRDREREKEMERYIDMVEETE